MFQNKFQTLSIFSVLLLAHIVAGLFYGQYNIFWVIAIVSIYLLLLYLGSSLPGWNFYFKARKHLPKVQIKFNDKGLQLNQNTQNIALCFSNVFSEQFTKLLPLLKREKIKATFFLNENDLEQNAQTIPSLKKGNHELGIALKLRPVAAWSGTKNISERISKLIETINKSGNKPVRFYSVYDSICSPFLEKALKSNDLTATNPSIHFSKKQNKLSGKLMPGSIIMIDGKKSSPLEAVQILNKEAKAKKFVFVSL